MKRKEKRKLLWRKIIMIYFISGATMTFIAHFSRLLASSFLALILNILSQENSLDLTPINRLLWKTLVIRAFAHNFLESSHL